MKLLPLIQAMHYRYHIHRYYV